jgi:hypothetical protein
VILDDTNSPTGTRLNVMPHVLCTESRVHNVVGLADHYDTEHGRRQLRGPVLFAHEFIRDVLDGRLLERRAPLSLHIERRSLKLGTLPPLRDTPMRTMVRS